MSFKLIKIIGQRYLREVDTWEQFWLQEREHYMGMQPKFKRSARMPTWTWAHTGKGLSITMVPLPVAGLPSGIIATHLSICICSKQKEYWIDTVDILSKKHLSYSIGLLWFKPRL